MNRFEFASNVIKASPLARVTDRAFAVPVLFACLAWYAALTNKTTFDEAMGFTKWMLAPFIFAEKGKDAIAAWAALKSETPATVNAGTANIDASTPPPPQGDNSA